jgi:hypothetical protein
MELYYPCVGTRKTTVESMNIELGDQIFYRVFKFNSKVAYLSSLLPKFRRGMVENVLGRCLIIRTDLISRDISDIYPLKSPSAYPNLYLRPDVASKKVSDESNDDFEEEDDFRGVATSGDLWEAEEQARIISGTMQGHKSADRSEVLVEEGDQLQGVTPLAGENPMLAPPFDEV